MTPRQQAIFLRFLLFLVAAELPVLSVQLGADHLDWRVLVAALLVPIAAAIEKAVSPQLSTEGIAPVAPVLPVPTVPN